MYNAKKDRQPVVILVHGIRDHALWQKEIRDTLASEGFTVACTNYGRFDLLRFLLPFSYFRRKATSEILNQINIVFASNPGAKISVVAHSFGTYIIGQILRDNFNLKFHKIIFCGCILKYNFPFEQFRERFDGDIVNEVGTLDIWPAVAESVTTGYGSAGTFGFHRPLVYDRWHNGAGHGYFLKRRFCQKYWIPFLRNGELVPDCKEPARPPALARLVSLFPLKYAIAGLLALAVNLGAQNQFQKSSDARSETNTDSCDITQTERALYLADVESAYKSTGWQLAWFDSWMQPPTFSRLRVEGTLIVGTAADGRVVSMSIDPTSLPSPQHYGGGNADLRNLGADCAAAISVFFNRYQVYRQSLARATSRPSDQASAFIDMNAAAREVVNAGRHALCTLGAAPPPLFPEGGFPEPVPLTCANGRPGTPLPG